MAEQEKAKEALINIATAIKNGPTNIATAWGPEYPNILSINAQCASGITFSNNALAACGGDTSCALGKVETYIGKIEVTLNFQTWQYCTPTDPSMNSGNYWNSGAMVTGCSGSPLVCDVATVMSNAPTESTYMSFKTNTHEPSCFHVSSSNIDNFFKAALGGDISNTQGYIEISADSHNGLDSNKYTILANQCTYSYSGDVYATGDC